ncbi:MAG: hypothetical protein KatS3mg066_0172 [Fischerella sp.]|nr:MAG: hypothetical protein KatS3mg066_0172 [Fischerella sp.]
MTDFIATYGSLIVSMVLGALLGTVPVFAINGWAIVFS